MIGKLISSAGFLSSGGTIGGDLTISGDLTVTGSSTYTYDESVDGQMWIWDSGASGTTAGGHLKLYSDDGSVMASTHRLGAAALDRAVGRPGTHVEVYLRSLVRRS